MAEESTTRKTSPQDAVPVSGSTRRYDGLLRYLGARIYQERDRSRRDHEAPEDEQKR